MRVLPLLLLVFLTGVRCLGADFDYTEPPENNAFGLKHPGDQVTAKVNPPGTIVDGKVVDAGGFEWVGGPGVWNGTVEPVTGGTHKGYFTGHFTRTGDGGGQLLTWQMSTSAAVAQARILKDGVDITDTGADTCVGLHVNLKVILKPDAAIASDTWTIPDTAIKDYQPSLQIAKVAPLADGDKKNVTISYYWITGGAKEVSVDVKDSAGNSYNAKTTIRVYKPPSTLQFVRHKIGIDTEYGDMFLDNPPPGIAFTGTFNPGPYGGITAYFQKVNVHVMAHYDQEWAKLTGHISSDLIAPTSLDTTFPYKFGLTASDTPGVTHGPGEDQLEDDFSAYMYFMYKPSGDSIWVPLRSVGWGWHGWNVKGDDGVWSLHIEKYSVAASGDGAEENSEPQWDKYVPASYVLTYERYVSP